jgi:hypothetical protein
MIDDPLTPGEAEALNSVRRVPLSIPRAPGSALVAELLQDDDGRWVAVVLDRPDLRATGDSAASALAACEELARSTLG